MTAKKKKKERTWTEIFNGERRVFPPGCAVTRVIPDKRKKKPKHKERMDAEEV